MYPESTAFKSGVPATGPRRWGGSRRDHQGRGPQRQVFVVGVERVTTLHKTKQDTVTLVPVSFCMFRESFASTKKSAPVINGGQVALVLSRYESFFGGLRLGGRWRGNEPRGEELLGFTAAPHLSGKPRHGEARCPGPPNCFPSTECARF